MYYAFISLKTKLIRKQATQCEGWHLGTPFPNVKNFSAACSSDPDATSNSRKKCGFGRLRWDSADFIPFRGSLQEQGSRAPPSRAGASVAWGAGLSHLGRRHRSAWSPEADVGPWESTLGSQCRGAFMIRTTQLFEGKVLYERFHPISV